MEEEDEKEEKKNKNKKNKKKKKKKKKTLRVQTNVERIGKIIRHNVVSARLRLGYKHLWQVAGEPDVPQFSSCPVCYIPNGNTLQHCLTCPEASDMLPQGQPLLTVCQDLLTHDNLDRVLARHELFGNC
ncbi:hypothetical protein E2C01_072733 [Portunus trituberculatus]|uniref:Uncharacterized protein n=1 Tax=Portunus trituberculatus TaxID=210409 RepID=A0A5B7IBG5_PORTR|nr:hypothetical protein [Portunus trituberculatus]